MKTPEENIEEFEQEQSRLSKLKYVEHFLSTRIPIRLMDKGAKVVLAEGNEIVLSKKGFSIIECEIETEVSEMSIEQLSLLTMFFDYFEHLGKNNFYKI